MLIAIVALTSLNCTARHQENSPEAVPVTQTENDTSAIPFDRLVELIAKGDQFDETKLTELGMKQLISEEESFEDEYDVAEPTEDDGTNVSSMLYFVYAQNTTATFVEGEHGRELRLTATGPHAYGFECHLDTDNGAKLYFKEKADHDAFLQCLRKSDEYSTNEYSGGVTEYIGTSLLQDDVEQDGWYIIDFHRG